MWREGKDEVRGEKRGGTEEPLGWRRIGEKIETDGGEKRKI